MEHSVEIKATVDRVYQFVQDQEFWESAFSGDVKVKKNYKGDPKVGDTFEISGRVAGQRLKATMEFTELVPPSRIVLDLVKGDFKDFRDTVVLERASGGSRLTETWEYQPPYSILGQIIDAVKIRKDMEKYLNEGLAKMKEKIERNR